MSAGSSDQDEQLLDEVAGLFAELDPVPDDLVRAAKQSLAWRRVDEILAELTADTGLVEQTGIRHGLGPRLLTFEAGPLTVEVEVAVTGAFRRLTGQLVPPGGGEVELRYPTGSQTTMADDLGHFTADVPAGPISLVCRPTGSSGPPVVTSWMTI